MARLPIPGSDEGSWGDILNGFLSQAHNTDGTIKDSAVNGIQGQPVSSTTPTDGQVLTYDSTTGQWQPQTSSGVPDATTSTKGVVQLAGDLGGTAAAPTVPGLASKENTITAGTSAQYWRGDKTFQTLDKTAVGLANVDNTTDANKPISTATQTALNQKGVLAYNPYTSSTTWSKTTGAKVVEVFVIGAGGGGGKGATAASGNVRLGGGGGAAGGVVVGQFDATMLTDNVTVTVGVGGAGGTDPAGSGVGGGNSSFGSYVSASGGGAGAGGSFVFPGIAGTVGATSLIVGNGGAAATGTFAASGTAGHVGGGAPGRSIDASNNANGFVGAGGSSPAGAGGASSGAQGGAGTAGTNGMGTNGGSGGGGGGSHTTSGSSGGAGGAGGSNGGGGGGGGAGTSAGVGGNGGAGGNGTVVVITYG